MKVGILSMQQITNFGSFLQAYGLKSILKEQGHEVEFINIIPGEQLPQYRISRFHKVKLMLRRLMVKHPIKQLACTLRLHRRFDKEFKPELGVTPGVNRRHYDAVVIGSDEVFNVAQRTWFGYSPQLFGEGLNADKVISYAGCFGATTTDILRELGIDGRIGKSLSSMAAISVRDRNSMEVVKALTGTDPSLNVDPVLAYGFEKEIRIPDIKEDFMIIYTYPGRMNNPAEVEAITRYAREHKLKIVANSIYFDWVDEVITVHPFELLGYFTKAKCVVTDTFHGAVLSIKYNKRFAVFVRGMNSNKLSYLLEQFDLGSRITTDAAELGGILDRTPDYTPVNEKIRKEQENTRNYLKTNL